jgi:hypothetical protein
MSESDFVIIAAQLKQLKILKMCKNGRIIQLKFLSV